MVKYNFRSICTVASAMETVDIILSRTQRKTPTVCHRRIPLPKIRAFYMRKVKFTSSGYHDRLGRIIEDFPKLDTIHPFYRDLMNVLYDKDHYKLALGHINTARSMIDSVSQDYVKQLKYADSLFRCKSLKKIALGRMTTIMKKQKSSLEYLEQVRQHLSRLPTIDPSTRCLLLTGFPNVGKSSFINQITRANVEVQDYAFTTKSLYVGHTDYNYNRYTVIDSPGVLDRPLEDRNVIEMQAITALAHLDCAVLFMVDVSPDCKYSIKSQCNLFRSLKPLYSNKPVVIICTKVDLRKVEDLTQEEQDEIKNLKSTITNCEMLTMSNVTEENVMKVRNQACDMLLRHRIRKKAQSGSLDKIAHRVHIAIPTKRDNKKRPPHYPPGVIEERRVEMKIRKRKRELDNLPRGGKSRMDIDEEDLPQKKRRKTLLDYERENGGAGVFHFNLREHWKLENPVWKNDEIPEFYMGRNVADFYHPGIAADLKALEAEEAKIMAEIGDSTDEEIPLPPGVKPLTKDQKYLIDEIRHRRLVAKVDRFVNDSRNKPVITRSRKTRTPMDLGELLEERALNPFVAEATVEDAAEKLRIKKSKRNAVLYGTDDFVTTTSKQPYAREQSRRSNILKAQLIPGLPDLAQKKLAKKLSDDALKQRRKGTNPSMSAGDNFIPGTLKHMRTGKRGIGKTDRR